MKKLPNNSLEWMSKLTYFNASEYKNRFVCYELKEDGLLKLTFFINPSQSISKHRMVATKKFNSMNKKMCFAKKIAKLLKIDSSKNNLLTYIYQVDVNFDFKLLSEEIKSFTSELQINETLKSIIEVHSNKTYAVQLALKETNGKFKELEKRLCFEINIYECHFSDLDIIKNIVSDIAEKVAS